MEKAFGQTSPEMKMLLDAATALVKFEGDTHDIREAPTSAIPLHPDYQKLMDALELAVQTAQTRYDVEERAIAGQPVTMVNLAIPRLPNGPGVYACIPYDPPIDESPAAHGSIDGKTADAPPTLVPLVEQLPKKRVPSGGVSFYSQPEIDANHKNAAHWGITVPGYYTWDGPEGDEILSGPFPSEQIAFEQFTSWRE